MAAVSINLAVVNSLPLPALDGGQIAFVIVEGARGRKIEQKTQDDINAYALFLLLVVSGWSTVGDIRGLFSIR